MGNVKFVLNLNIMTNQQLAYAIDKRIEQLQNNTHALRDLFPKDLEAIISKEVAYMECRNIILKVMEEEGC